MKGFHFYGGIDQPLNLTALTLAEFYKIIKQVNVSSIEFHLYRGDFEKWVKEACKESELAEEIGSVKAEDLKGEDLRAKLLKVLDAKYSVQDSL